MQGITFKTILEQLEANGDLLSAWHAVHGVSGFDALAASVSWTADSKDAANGGVSGSAMGAYADNVITREARPVRPQTRRAMSLAQLREKLGSGLSIGELRSLRRRFAFEHHPDRLPANEREAANSRLAMANDLIDLAIQNTGGNPAG